MPVTVAPLEPEATVVLVQAKKQLVRLACWPADVEFSAATWPAWPPTLER